MDVNDKTTTETRGVAIKGDVLMFKLSKLDGMGQHLNSDASADLRSNEPNNKDKLEMGVFGYFDKAEIEKANSFTDIIGNFNEYVEKGDAGGSGELWHKLSLFSFDGVTIKELKKALKGRITMVSMIKLNPFLPAKYEDGVSYMEAMTKQVKGKIEEHCALSETTACVHVYSSLSSYDIVVFITPQNPADAFKALSYMTRQLSTDCLFSTSFYMFNSTTAAKSYKKYAQYKNAHLQIRFCFDICVSVQEADSFAAKITKGIIDNPPKVEYITGDDDFVFTISETNFYNCIRLYNKITKVKRESNYCVRIHSLFIYDNIDDLRGSGGNAKEIRANREYKMRLRRYLNGRVAKIRKQYSNIKGKLPLITQHDIEGILMVCDSLCNAEQHMFTVDRATKFLERALYRHSVNLKENKKKQKEPPSIVKFSKDLNLAMPSLTSGDSIYIDSIIDLSIINPYSKLVAAFANFVTEIYYIGCDKDGFKNKLDILLVLNNSTSIGMTTYFRDSDEDEINVQMACLNLGSPFLFSLVYSYSSILHEIAHIQPHTAMWEARCASFRDTVLRYIAMHIYFKKWPKDMGEKKADTFYEILNDLHILFQNAAKGWERKLYHTDKFIDSLIMVFFEMTKASEEALRDLERENATPQVTLRWRVYTEALNDLNLAKNDLIRTLANVQGEALADIMAICMGGYTLEKYFEILFNHFYDNAITPGNDTNFRLRVAMVLECFESNAAEGMADDLCQGPDRVGQSVAMIAQKLRNTPGDNSTYDEKIEKAGFIDGLYKESRQYRTLAVPFRQFVEKSGLTTELKDKMIEKWSTYAGVKKPPEDYEIEEEVQFYLNQWFKRIKDYIHELAEAVPYH